MNTNFGKLALCFGTRPQVVKASVLIEALEQEWDVLAVDTGQHYDWDLRGLHYDQLGIRRPDRFLDVGSSDPSKQTAEVISRTASELAKWRPDLVVVIGDTNSTLGCALAAAKEDIPLVHVEAGLRCGEFSMPEEVNRRVVDELSALLCTPSKRSTDYLLNRVSRAQSVTFTGDVAFDVLVRALRNLEGPETTEVAQEPSPPHVLLTIHREEITKRRDWLADTLAATGSLPFPVFFPVHPRTLEALGNFGLLGSLPQNLHLASPQGYLELVARIQNSVIVVTDSGGIQREAYWLGIPCITLRGETEWTETVAEGANILLPPDRVADLEGLIESHPGRHTPWEARAYGDGNASDAVCAAIKHRFL